MRVFCLYLIWIHRCSLLQLHPFAPFSVNGCVLSVCNYYLSLFSSECADLLTYPLNLVIECSLLLEVSHLILICLVFEVLALLCGQGLPLLADLLHNLEGPHLRVGINNKRSCLFK